jgi:hypothetical protein
MTIMTADDPSFPDLVRKTFEKINQHSGANEEFYKRFSRSRVLISHWKSGKLVASYSDQTEFVKVATEVIKEFSEKHEALRVQNEQMIKEFQTLLA